MMHREPWDQVVADAAPSDHIVQLYQDQDFLNRAVCRFARAGIASPCQVRAVAPEGLRISTSRR